MVKSAATFFPHTQKPLGKDSDFNISFNSREIFFSQRGIALIHFCLNTGTAYLFVEI